MKTKDIVLQQIKYLKDIQAIGYNIVTCGDCGATLIISRKDTKVNCVCNLESDLCDCPDLWTVGDENNY